PARIGPGRHGSRHAPRNDAVEVCAGKFAPRIDPFVALAFRRIERGVVDRFVPEHRSPVGSCDDDGAHKSIGSAPALGVAAGLSTAIARIVGTAPGANGCPSTPERTTAGIRMGVI